MRLSFLILLSIVSGICLASAQQLHLTVTGIPGDSAWVYVEGFYGADRFSVDSVMVRNKSTATIKLPAGREGLYSMRVEDGDACFFVTASDSLIRFNTAFAALLKGKCKPDHSLENDALAELLAAHDQFKQTRDSLDGLGARMDEFDPKYDTRSRAIRNAYNSACDALNKQLLNIKTKYAATYTATVLAPLLLVALPDSTQQLKYDTHKSFNHYHFFDKMPLENEGILANPFFEERLMDYLIFYTHHRDEEKLKKDLSYMLDSLSSNAAVKDFIRYALMKHYLKKGPQEIINFLSEKSAAEGCENTSPYQTNTAVKNLLSTLPGKQAPQLALKDLNGSSRTLSGVMFGKKAGVIVFWASWCGHCRDSIPVFYDWYLQQRDKGLEVYSISLDQDPREWASFTETLTPGWVNVSELKGWEAESVSLYNIRSTPTYIALDENRNILFKTNYMQELKEKLLPLLDKK